MSWLNLENKVVIVTGGKSGIGKEIVKEYLKQNCKVVIADIQDKTDNILDEFENKENMLYVKCDVSKVDNCKNVIDKTIEKFGQIDILVNNAGINLPGVLIDINDKTQKYVFKEDTYDKIMDINVKGLFFMSQFAASEMAKRKQGVIVNISSDCGLEGSVGQCVYAASKTAVVSLTRSWCKELGKHNIRVVAIAPGLVEATALRNIQYEEGIAYARGVSVEKLREGYISTTNTPLGRAGKLTEIADSVVYISSDRASYIHGITLNVNGGKAR